MEQQELALELILQGGKARELAYSALELAKSGDFEGAGVKLKEAETEIAQGHALQKEFLSREARGVSVPPTLLLVHAHWHLMGASSEKNLIEELIALYRRLENK